MRNNTSNSSESKQHLKEFLLSAISDLSERIKSIETKVGITLAVYSLIIGMLIEARRNIYDAIRIMSDYGLCCVSIYVGFMIFAFLCISVSIFNLLETIGPEKYDFADIYDLSKEHNLSWTMGMYGDGTGSETKYKNYYNNIIQQDEDGIIRYEALKLLKRKRIWTTKQAYVNKAMGYLKMFLVSVALLGVVTVIVNTCAGE